MKNTPKFYIEYLNISFRTDMGNLVNNKTLKSKLSNNLL